MIVWCSNTLVQNPWNYCLVTTQKEHDKVLKKNKIDEIAPDDERLVNAAATVSFYTSPKGAKIAIVKVGPKLKKYNKAQVDTVLVHEAVHIWQAVRETLYEDNPSSEFEAYSIQKISHELILAYKRAVKKSKKK